jgi:hypothetical protein
VSQRHRAGLTVFPVCKLLPLDVTVKKEMGSDWSYPRAVVAELDREAMRQQRPLTRALAAEILR